jgi:hypothetical protein
MDMATKSRAAKVEIDLPEALLAEAEHVARREGKSLQTLIAEALSERLAAVTDEFNLAARSARGNPERAVQILRSLRRDGPVIDGDEVG